MFGTSALDERIARLEAQVRAQQGVIEELCRRFDIDPPVGVPGQWLDDTERRLVAEGKKIAAIKHYRERTGAGLKEAKDAVDRA